MEEKDLYYDWASHINDKEDIGDSGHDIDIEIRMILYTNTVIDPGTVMVKPFNASITDIAMSAPLSPDYFTLRA